MVEEQCRAEAIRLLQTTALSVAQIARRLGYADASSFSRAFQKWTSASPGAYRTSVIAAQADSQERRVASLSRSYGTTEPDTSAGS